MDIEDTIFRTGTRDIALRGTRVHVLTMGCAHNEADSDQIESEFVTCGAILSDFDSCDVLFVNSCTVKTPSEEKAFFQAERGLTLGKIVVLGGCVPEALKKLKRLDQWVENGKCMIIGVLDSLSLNTLLKRISENEEELSQKPYIPQLQHVRNDISRVPLARSRKNVDIIPLCVGCLGECTYCETLHARGRLASYPVDSLVQRVRGAIEAGVTELWFTGEDTLAWGQEQGTDFAELWKALAPLLEGTSVMVRVGMTDPESVIGKEQKLVSLMENKHVYKFLHLPVQSASDSVLAEMKRRYTYDQYRELVLALRGGVPGIAIATDYIVGFPGETEEDHNLSIESMLELRFDIVNVTQYYPRSGTPAAKMEEVPEAEKRHRSAELHKASIIDFEATRKSFLGQIHNVSVFEILEKPEMMRLFGCKAINELTVVLQWFFDEQQSIEDNVTKADSFGVRIGSIVCCEIIELTRVSLVGKFLYVCENGELVGRLDNEGEE